MNIHRKLGVYVLWSVQPFAALFSHPARIGILAANGVELYIFTDEYGVGARVYKHYTDYGGEEARFHEPK